MGVWRTVIQNIVFSLVVKAIVVVITLALKASIWLAILTDVGSLLIVTLNGMRLLRVDVRKSDKKETEDCEDRKGGLSMLKEKVITKLKREPSKIIKYEM